MGRERGGPESNCISSHKFSEAEKGTGRSTLAAGSKKCLLSADMRSKKKKKGNGDRSEIKQRSAPEAKEYISQTTTGISKERKGAAEGAEMRDRERLKERVRRRDRRSEPRINFFAQ